MSGQKNDPNAAMRQRLNVLKEQDEQHRKRSQWMLILPFLFAGVLFVVALFFVGNGQKQTNVAKTDKAEAAIETKAAEEKDAEAEEQLAYVEGIKKDSSFIQKEASVHLNTMDQYANAIAEKLNIQPIESRSDRQEATLAGIDNLIANNCPNPALHSTDDKDPCEGCECPLDHSKSMGKTIIECPALHTCAHDSIWTELYNHRKEFSDRNKFKSLYEQSSAANEVLQSKVKDLEDLVDSLKQP